MDRSTRTIYWRPELQSFLPAIEDPSARALLERELVRHVSGMEQKTILPLGELFEKHLEQRKLPDGSTLFVKNAQSTHLMSDIDSCARMDAALRAAYGKWIPVAFSYHALRDASSGDGIPAAVDRMLTRLKHAHRECDGALRKLHDKTAPGSDLRESVRQAMLRRVRREFKKRDFDDRWFGSISAETPLYLESLGCIELAEQVDEIASKHFQSWCEPTEDAVQRFADEIAALAVKGAFEEKYGPASET